LQSDQTRPSCEFIHFSCHRCNVFRVPQGGWRDAPCSQRVKCKCVSCRPWLDASRHWDSTLVPRKCHCINATQYTEKANAIIVSALQVTAQKIAGTTEFRGKLDCPKGHLTQRRQQDNGHFSSDDKRVVATQTLTQTLKHELRQAREEGAIAHVITDLGKSHAMEKQELLKLQH